MVLTIGVFEWMTKTTLKVMFHIWYMWGVWLSWFILDDEDESNPFAITFAKEEAVSNQTKEEIKK